MIKEHAVAVALDLRRGARSNDLMARLAGDARLGLSRGQLDAAAPDPLELTGAARSQVDRIAAAVTELAERHPAGASYVPGDVL